MSDLPDLLRLADAVEALTMPRTHREPLSYRQGNTWVHVHHTTHVSSLIRQLEEAIEPQGSIDSGHAVPASRPAARLDAIDTLLTIDVEVSAWVDHMGLYLRGSLQANLRAIVGGALAMDKTELTLVSKAASRWVTWARVTTGWDVPARQPNNTCPLCGVRGGLRVRVGDGVTSTEASAMCLECRESWDTNTIGLLAEHIRAENGDEALEPLQESA